MILIFLETQFQAALSVTKTVFDFLCRCQWLEMSKASKLYTLWLKMSKYIICQMSNVSGKFCNRPLTDILP